MDARNAVIETLLNVAVKKQSSHAVLPKYLSIVDPKDRGLYHRLSLGMLREYFFLTEVVEKLIDKPPKKKDFDLLLIMMLGIYQAKFTDIPDHAALHSCVELCSKRKKKWAKAWVNKCLRQWQKNASDIIEQIPDTALYSIPQWWLKKLKKQWPDHWQEILRYSREPAKNSLNINSPVISSELYLEKLNKHAIPFHSHPLNPNSITLDANLDISQLPGYAEGEFFVQDAGAQLAAQLLRLEPQHRVLDSCAAPGGKTADVAKYLDNAEQLVAVEFDATRFERLQQNMQRLNCAAQLVLGDATQPATWWDKQAFDRILLDAPCSAAGIIRRHPDIKLLRQQIDLVELGKLQAQILRSLWPLLKPGGLLLYITCSVFAEENQKQIQRFCEGAMGATILTAPTTWGVDTGYGQQLLPGAENDGFFYALLQKQS